jgi:hypothetical protein
MRVRLLSPRYDALAAGVEESLRRLEGNAVDLLLICHSVPLVTAASMIQEASTRCEVEQILWLAEWQTVSGSPAAGTVVSMDSRNQPWLVETEKLLQSKVLSLIPVPRFLISTGKAAGGNGKVRRTLPGGTAAQA